MTLVRLRVQISGNQPPLLEQKQASAASGLTCGCGAKAYTVPDEPRLMVMSPGSILPVPIAAIMLSPPPLDTTALGFRPSNLAICGRMRPTGWRGSISSGKACSRWPSGSM